MQSVSDCVAKSRQVNLVQEWKDRNRKYSS